MKNKLNLFQKSLISVLILLIIVLLIFFNQLEISDELWNFQNIFKMSNGLSIYKDANVIVTPIFFYIGNIFFKILGSTIISFRIYNILIFAFMYFLTFKILQNLKVSKHLSFLYVSLIFLQTFSIVTAGANYNTLAIAFVLLGINLYIKNTSLIYQGIVAFLVFFTKQNIGIYYIIATIIYDLYCYKISKNFFKAQLIKLLAFIVPSSVIILKLYFDGVLLDFINFAFGGLLEFGQNNISFSASIYQVILFMASIVLYVFIILKKNSIFKKIITNEIFKILTLLIIFNCCISLIIYPIANGAHFLFAMPLHLIFIFYLLNTLIINELYGDKKYSFNTIWICAIILIAVIIRIGFNYFENINEYSYIKDSSSPFNRVLLSNEEIEKKSVIKKYIKEKNAEGIDVIIFSYDSAISMIELKQSHGVYDLLFNGNLGFNGKEKLKNDILSRENTEFLVVTNDYDIFQQEPPEIRDFIIQNLNYKGSVWNYSVYGK